ncbi:DMT family transporter [Acidithiobacillus thiooxidans]|uniref:DMT family transporter n=1 Tax=Acidithiobacillus thiooxidans TaxID=930 RepID=UPI001C06A198|nr:multidrug resistance efflux transporter family protein [Acidithiobacillus thiooxidans]MBU2841634.1 multidrug resistance efflux transporter family protein [Acidithiobacillus thiooxidans]
MFDKKFKHSFSLAISAGLLSSLFFSVTFVLNKALDNAGYSWQWSASLRYLITLPILLVIFLFVKNKRPLLDSLKKRPIIWMLWGTVGFGLFYAPLTLAAFYGPAWLVAGLWQITILAGMLLDGLISRNHDSETCPRRFPWRSFVISLAMLFGVLLILWDHLMTTTFHDSLFIALPVLLACFAYPLGNRMIISRIDPAVGSMDRMLGMTIGSLPFWCVLGIWGQTEYGWPPLQQVGLAALIAVSSGVVATGLFYYATRSMYPWPDRLAAVEATQAGEVLFAVLGSIFWLGEALPGTLAQWGLVLIVLAMLGHVLPSELFRLGRN